MFYGFNFSIPNITSSSSVEFEVSIASNCKTSIGTSQTYSIGSTTLLSSTLPVGSDFGRSINTMNYNTPSDFMTLNISITRNTPDVLTYLDRILLNTRRDLVFIDNQFRFRDLNSEINKFIPVLKNQIKIIEPKIIVGLGKVVGKALLNENLSMDLMRYEVHSFSSYPLKITYSPNTLLREQSLKKLAWEDFKFIRDFIK